MGEETSVARFKNEQIMIDALKPHLGAGEVVRHVAFGVKQPAIGLILLLYALAVLPGIIATALLTKEYVIGLTDRRLIVLRFSGRLNVREVVPYDLSRLPPVKTSTGGLFTHIKIDSSEKPFVAKFHRLGMANNREHAMAIADVLQRQSVAAQPA